MKCNKNQMLLYAVTDRAWTQKQSLYQQVEDALKGGVTCVQLREKELDEKEFLSDNIYKIILRKGEISLWMH